MILVSIVGDFITNISPVIYEFKEKISKHVLIYDDARYEKRSVERVRHAVDYVNEEFGLSIEQFESVIDEDSKKDIDALTQELFAFAEDPRDIYLNATDGPANIAIMLASVILKNGGHVIVYDKMDNTYNLLYGNNMRTLAIKNCMDAKDYCNMLGMRILDFKRKKKMRKHRKEIVWLFRNYGRFNVVRRALADGTKNFPYKKYPEVLKRLKAIGVIDASRNVLDRNYLYGGMFEEYVYAIVRKLDFDAVMVNLTVAVDYVGKAAVKNEFDILMINNNHPCIIECKHKRNINGDNLVYKYDAIRDDFGPDTKVMIVNISDKHKISYRDKKISSSFTRGNINRAIVNNIDIYHENTVDETALLKRFRRFFGVGEKKKREGEAIETDI